MIYDVSYLAVGLFLGFVLFVVGISFYLGSKAKSADGYYAAGGSIHWAVNGVAFAGDYLSAASFLGICGMIATKGYDGFLYSIGYLAGWMVALFLVAEPMKRLGKYTFTDALDSKFNAKSIQLTAAISTLIVSIFYLIPQMVGAGVLVEPLMGWDHWVGVVLVGIVVTIIVATAGMASTTYVQFLKGGLLIVFSAVLTIGILSRGLFDPDTKKGPFSTEGSESDKPYHHLKDYDATVNGGVLQVYGEGAGEYKFVKFMVAVNDKDASKNKYYALMTNKQDIQIKDGEKVSGYELETIWQIKDDSHSAFSVQGEKGNEKVVAVDGAKVKLHETLFKKTLTQDVTVGGVSTKELYNGAPKEAGLFFKVGSVELICSKELNEKGECEGNEVVKETGSLNPLSFLSSVRKSRIILWDKSRIIDGDNTYDIHYQKPTSGKKILRPGMKFKVGKTFMQNLNFVSLMLALFCGTAALPHILIRYYTVPSQSAARKSTIVAIGAIGFFYVLTLFMGLGAMTNGVINIDSGNMSAPLMALSFGVVLFSIISSIAFSTVLGTVSGLIVAASGAVAHDLLTNFMGIDFTETGKVKAGKIAAICVGAIAIVLGIAFKGMNVSFLVGWAFAVAASANLPAIMMILFWKRTTYQGVAASIVVGIVSALTIILLSPTMFDKYGYLKSDAPWALDNPGIVSIPLAFITLIVVSLMTNGTGKTDEELEAENA